MDEKEKEVKTEAPEVKADIVEPKKSNDVEVDSEVTKKLFFHFAICGEFCFLFHYFCIKERQRQLAMQMKDCCCFCFLW